MSISWTTESLTTPSLEPPIAGQVQVDRVERVDPGRALRRQPDLVQVGVVAVAGADVGDGLVGGVVDHVLALAEADFEDASLPPGQDRLALVLLDLEVGRLDSPAGSG